ncbi:hypothetical protein ACIBAG_40240 [Streptomyces sp. NPDC051243]|uniref:hypothetical protein n=1 Tax=Streptomyces sp. NPDC051243 TaxID=3365646 RepID=UPI00379F863A
MVESAPPGPGHLLRLRREGSSEALAAALTTRGEQLTARTRAMLSGAGRLDDYLGCGGE